MSGFTLNVINRGMSATGLNVLHPETIVYILHMHISGDINGRCVLYVVTSEFDTAG